MEVPAAAALHVLKLPEDPVLPGGDYSRFSMRWLLDPGSASGVATGDLVQLDELLSGAGECEGLRWVGPADAAGRRELLTGDVESPVFPRAVAERFGPGGEALRQRYELGLEKVLSLQGFTLADIFGGSAEEFWAAPDVVRREKPLEGEWVLASCTVVATHRFPGSAAASAPEPEPEPHANAAAAASSARASRATQLLHQQQICATTIPGSIWIYDKARLSKTLSADHNDPLESFDVEEGLGRVAGLGQGVGEVEILPTWYIRGGEWCAPPRADGRWKTGANPTANAPWASTQARSDAVWFLKETNRNYSAGVTAHPTVASCLQSADPTKEYVVQPHYAKPMLRDGRKFHIRLCVLRTT